VLQQMGLRRRMGRLLPPSRPALWLPLDDRLISGPEDHLRDLRTLLTPEIVGNLDAVLGFRGDFTACQNELAGTPLIMNLSASTIRHEHTRKVLIGAVNDAVLAGADAIACHVNLTSPYEAEQAEQLSRRVTEADALGIPVVAMVYPRTRRADGGDENYTELREREPEQFAVLVRQCVALARSLGASAVKTVYTGTEDSFRSVVTAAMDMPVLIAGEKLADEVDAIDRALSAIRTGARGIAFGRQIFARPDPAPFVSKLRHALDDEWQARQAQARLSQSSVTAGASLAGPVRDKVPSAARDQVRP
jgi:DhnA family fructose-bisphosphate aldolase class Ia